MLFLLNWRMWLAVAFLALLPVTYYKGRHDGSKLAQADFAKAQAVAAENARLRERAMQKGVDDAQRLAATREASIRAAAIGARRDADGLRGDLDTARQFASQSHAAAERVARVSTELLGECSREYLSMAETAARADSEARTLRQAWPK